MIRLHYCRIAVAVALAMNAAPAAAQQQTPPRPSCGAAEHRAFDFWIGEWTVTNPRGAVVGTSRIEAILDGCAIYESWTGGTGSNGHSFNIYDRASGRWHQTWVDNGGMLLQLEGGLEGTAMVLSGALPGANGVALQRITWTPNEDGTVRQHWESSDDEGETWGTLFDGLYRRR